MPPRQSPAQKLAAKLLLGGQWAPVTTTIGYLKQPLNKAAVAWREWLQSSPYQSEVGIGVTAHTGTLPELLEKLLPLGYGMRWLLVETRNPEWTAVFHNTRDDPNLRFPLKELPLSHGVTTIGVTDEPKNIKRMPEGPARGRWGGRDLTVYDQNGLRRFLSLYNSEPWKFAENGEPYDFENTEQYLSPRAVDCFPHETLVEICRNLELDPFEEDFYVPKGRGIMLEILMDPDNPPPGDKYTLAEARAGYDDVDRGPVEEPAEGNALYPLGSRNPPPDAVFPMTGFVPFKAETPFDAAVKAFEASVQRYSSYPATASLSEGLAEDGVLALPSIQSPFEGGPEDRTLGVLVSPELLQGPAELREYTAAFMALQWKQKDGTSPETFHPNRKQMNLIRTLCQEQGTYPFDVAPTQVYFTVAVDKLIRSVTDLRITDEFLNPAELIAVTKEGEPAEAQPNRSVSWGLRLHIQEHEDAIWNAALDDRSP
ncbi:hypothetical protein [Paenarthrobacter sp. NPDC090522]|uniref:hypothetical protein n=1 Tax=Paenarthrobacter sp. NPDC090522 TaxID=3364383 RepID=UPI0038115FA1